MKNPRKIFGDFVVFLLFESSETERHSLRFADFFSGFPVDEIHAVDERLNLLVHKVKVEFVHMFVARRIDRAEIIGGGNERDFGDMLFGQRLSFAEVHRVVRAKGGCPDVFPVFYRLVINLVKVFVAGVNKFGIDTSHFIGIPAKEYMKQRLTI